MQSTGKVQYLVIRWSGWKSEPEPIQQFRVKNPNSPAHGSVGEVE